MNQVKMTYVLPTFNRAAHLSGTVNSILEQTVKDIELIVLDDGSEDCTWEMLEYFTNRDKRIKRVRFDKRGGAARCRNVGNEMAQSEWVHVADAGDIYHYSTTKIMLNSIKKNPEVEVLYSSVGIMDARGKVTGKQDAEPYKMRDRINFSHPSVAYKRSIFANYRYREVSMETDCYEAFFLEVAADRHRFSGIKNLLLLKREVPAGEGSRDLVAARKIKREIYREFNLDWPFKEVA